MALSANFKAFDWRALQRYFSPHAADDLNRFLEQMPQTAGNTILIAAGIAWLAAGVLGVYTGVQTVSLIKMRADLADTKALKPLVPTISNVAVPPGDLGNLATTLSHIYPDLSIKQQGPAIFITAKSTEDFGEFREAVSHVQNGGSGWRVDVDKLCAGRECTQAPLAILLKIGKVSVDKPK